MIRLTWKLGEKSGALYVPENVIVLEHEGKTFVTQSLDDHTTGIEVTESPEEVARKVLEWRLAMGRYKHGNGHERHMAEIELQQLAGLKETLADQAERIVKEYLAGLEEPNHDAG